MILQLGHGPLRRCRRRVRVTVRQPVAIRHRAARHGATRRDQNLRNFSQDIGALYTLRPLALAVVLVGASIDCHRQSRRHCFILSLDPASLASFEHLTPHACNRAAAPE